MFKKYILALLSILILSSGRLIAQQEKNHPFELVGNINIDTGQVILLKRSNSIYYPALPQTIIAHVEKGKFKINGEVPYPVAFFLTANNTYQSGTFWIEPGSQTITFDVNLFRKVPVVQNQIMGEFNSLFAPFFAKTKLKNDSLSRLIIQLNATYHNHIPDSLKVGIDQATKIVYKQSDEALLKFVTEHPDSYIGLGRLIDLMDFGYEGIFDKIYNNFSDSIKNKYAAKTLYQQLKVSRALAVGKSFPDINVVDINGGKLDVRNLKLHKFTLIDFWYSHCTPCIGQFDNLSKVYNTYQTKGFEIIGISTDQTKYKDNWQKVIKNHGLKWAQYLDVDGIISNSLSINAFPTNFLLDNKGQVIAKDLSPAELAQFLGTHM